MSAEAGFFIRQMPFLKPIQQCQDTLRHVAKADLLFRVKTRLNVNSLETVKHCFAHQQNTVDELVGRTPQGLYTTEQLLSIAQQEVLWLLKCTDVQILQHPAQLVYNSHLTQTKLFKLC